MNATPAKASPDQIRANIAEVHDRIRRACEDAGRDPGEVRLLLATKTVGPDLIRTAIEAGETLVAENRVQEVGPKSEALSDLTYERHFIGNLQSNKINALLPHISCLQSLDRISLAEKLDRRLERDQRTLDVLLQVNTSREESKYGVEPDRLAGFAEKVAGLERLKVKGLMTIGLFSDDLEAARPSLKLLADLRERIRELDIDGVEMDELSMGMSRDLEVAVEEGATIVRVGTAIFGARDTPDSAYWPDSG